MQSIELTDSEAAMYLLFRKHERNFKLLLMSGVMDIREGSFEAHFNSDGEVGAIKAHVNVYKRDPDAAIVVINTLDRVANKS